MKYWFTFQKLLSSELKNKELKKNKKPGDYSTLLAQPTVVNRRFRFCTSWYRTVVRSTQPVSKKPFILFLVL